MFNRIFWASEKVSLLFVFSGEYEEALKVMVIASYFQINID